MSYRTILERLESYEPRALGRGGFFDYGTGLCCAIGAVRGLTSGPALREHRNAQLRGIVDTLGATDNERSAVAVENDRKVSGETPEQRYQRVVQWLRQRVAEEAGHE